MKVVLVNPNQLNPFEVHNTRDRDRVLRDVSPSLTLGYLLASVEGAFDIEPVEHMLEYLKISGVRNIDLRETARKHLEDADVVGISSITTTRKASLDFVRLARETGRAKIVLGGPFATTMTRQILTNYPVDVIVLGEAEQTFPEVLNRIRRRESLEDIQGIAFVKGGEIYFTPPRTPVQNLDELPFPDYSRYFNLDSKGEIKTASVMTSRGCPYTCNFCSRYFGRKVRFRSPENVALELRLLKERGIETVRFEDDTLTLDRDRAVDLFERIGEFNLGLTLHMITRFGHLDDVLVEKYVGAGGRSVDAAVETGSASLRRLMGKNVSDEQIYHGVRLLRNHGVDVYLYVMLGYPGETEEDLKKTVEMLRRIKPKGLTCSIFHVYPGVPVYDKLKARGIVGDWDFLDEDKAKIYAFGEEGLELRRRYQKQILTEFGITDRLDYRGMASDGKVAYDKLVERGN